MASRRRVKIRALLANADLRRELMVSTIQATQAREGIDTTREQADRAYYVVTESDKAAFFDLKRVRRGVEPGSHREDEFVRALRGEHTAIRFDVARRDFAILSGSPLAYSQALLLAPAFRTEAPLNSGWADVRGGMNSTDSERFVRFHWEVSGPTARTWVSYSKGGSFARFYADLPLRFDWTKDGQEFRGIVKKKYGSESRFVKSPEFYFRRGLTWTEKSSLGLSVRVLNAGAIFNVAGPAAFPHDSDDEWYLLAILNSTYVAFAARALSGRSYGATYVGALPVARPSRSQHERLSRLAKEIHDCKAAWATGDETCSNFERPWLMQNDAVDLDVAARLNGLVKLESAGDSRIQSLYSEINSKVYSLYRISDVACALIGETMGRRPPEMLWSDMERKTDDQKRMEHVWRLLSYVVKRVVEADDDGIVPFIAVGGEAPLVDRVRAELGALFPSLDLNQVEVGITNELKRRVKGYRRVETLAEWLRDEYFDYHTSLYQNRPILWHIASAQGRGQHSFGAIVQYHKFDHNRLAKLRGTYLRDAIAHFRREAGLADQEGRTEDRQEWQAKLEEAEQLDRRLQWVQEGTDGHPAPGDCRIRTPWKSDEQQPKGWRPDLDDGVVVNIAPLQTAGVLRAGGAR